MRDAASEKATDLEIPGGATKTLDYLIDSLESASQGYQGL